MSKIWFTFATVSESTSFSNSLIFCIPPSIFCWQRYFGAREKWKLHCNEISIIIRYEIFGFCWKYKQNVIYNPNIMPHKVAFKYQDIKQLPLCCNRCASTMCANACFVRTCESSTLCRMESISDCQKYEIEQC